MASVPSVWISQRAYSRWKRQHPWIYRSDVRRVEAESGDIVRVMGRGDRVLGWAFYSEASEISLRRVGRGKEPLPKDVWRQRILQADQRRRRLMPQANKVYRLLHGEADGIPATIIDRYVDIFVIQTLCPASDRLRDHFVSILQEEFSPTAIVERNDAKVRKLEGLEQTKGLLFGSLPEEPLLPLDGILRVHFDPLGGQKTGAYLDQAETRRRTMPLVRGAQRILEACCYQGWFSCCAAAQQRDVISVDSSEPALAILQKNATINQLDDSISTIANNVFEQLREFDRAQEKFDLIFLDPPSFIKNRSAFASGLRGYKELNLRSLRLLPPGGVLVTSSCSYHLPRERFWELAQEVASDQSMDLQLLDIWGQGPDHPCLSNFPESDYLKTLVIQRLN